MSPRGRTVTPIGPEEDERALWEAFFRSAPRRLPRGSQELVARCAPSLVAELAAVGAPPRVLDVGCGAGQDLATLAAAGLRAVGVDLAQTALVAAGGSGAAGRVRADLRRGLPFADGVFGAVTSRFVLSGAFSDEASVAALAEMARVAAPGGMLLLSVRSTDDSTYRACGSPAGGAVRCGGQGLRFWSRRRLREALVASGWDLLELSAIQGGPEEAAALEAVARRASAPAP